MFNTCYNSSIALLIKSATIIVSMNNRILTPHEREVITQYLNGGERSMAVRVYLSRARKAYSIIKEDMDLLEQLLHHC